ncbi:MAG: hypothetical protein IKZ88_10265 [Neisseriaceae bacterium]|nr:hypothetical protein [Neisseriaceae bacterium]
MKRRRVGLLTHRKTARFYCRVGIPAHQTARRNFLNFNHFYSALSGGLVGKNAHPTAFQAACFNMI